MELGDRLRQLCDKKGVTRYDIAKVTGISEATLSRMWAGDTKKPQRKNIEILSQYFNVSAQWLLTGEGDMLKPETVDTAHPIKPAVRDADERFDRLMNIAEMQSKQIEAQNKQIEMLMQKIDRLEKQASENGLRPNEASGHI